MSAEQNAEFGAVQTSARHENRFSKAPAAAEKSKTEKNEANLRKTAKDQAIAR